jgi:hypothetical protein
MKISTKDLTGGMKIQYVGHHKFGDRLVVLCGSIKKNSPIVKIEKVENSIQQFKFNKGVKVFTSCGLELFFSTKQKVKLI